MFLVRIRHAALAAALCGAAAPAVSAQERSADFPTYMQPGFTFTPGISLAGMWDSNVALAAPVAVLRVDGFFFNEVRNEASSSQITLTALVDFSQKAQANVNLVSHIEKARVEVLLADGIPFEKAKEQALAEVFGIFGFEVESSGFSEDLELAPHVDAEQGVGQGGALGYGGAALDEAWAELSDAATLLAISSIFLGYRSDGSVSEVVANVATDLRLDGDLDSESSLVALVAHARRLDASAIREHLEERYEAFGQSIELPPFEDKIQQFVDAHTEVPFQPLAEYEEGSLLARLASGSDGMTLESGVPLNLRINGHGVPVRLVLKGRPGLWTYLTDGENLDVSNFAATCEQEFSVVDENSPTHNEITFDGPSEFEVEVYEGRFDEPSWTRTFVTSTEHDLGFPISCPEN